MALLTPKRLLVCRSQDFQVDYSINPWMKPGTSDSSQAVRQWEEMVRLIKSLGVEVEVAEFPEDAPQELIWTRDAFMLINNQVVLANFKYEVRQAETPYYERWFKDHGFSTVRAQTTFEGGNVIPHNGRYYMGIGFRADESDALQLSQQLGIEVVPLAVTDNTFFHLDLALFSLDSQNAFYYPPAFTSEAAEMLKSQIANLQEFNKEEMAEFCANSITIGNNVIIQAGVPSFRRKLEALGKTVHEVDVSEFKNIGGGGVHCLTNVLEWR